MRRGGCSKENRYEQPYETLYSEGSEHSRQATQAISSPTKGIFLNEGKNSPWHDKAVPIQLQAVSEMMTAGRQGRLSACAQQERANRCSLASPVSRGLLHGQSSPPEHHRLFRRDRRSIQCISTASLS